MNTLDVTEQALPDASTRPKLDSLISRVGDAALRDAIAHAVADMREGMRFGVDYSRHLPEVIRLPFYRVARGENVMLRDESDRTMFRVVGFTDRSRTTARVVPVMDRHGEPVHDDEVRERASSDLVVVRQHGEAVYPGLLPSEPCVVTGPSTPATAPTHVAIKGENLHALEALNAVYTDAAGNGMVDLIYIDPPYNTGNKSWIYNDKYVSEGDRDSSSKWVGFMARRLQIARRLLKPTGVILVAIGDAEHHRLRLLMDRIFGPENFLANVTWQGSVKSNARFTGAGVDYMLAYAQDKAGLVALDARWMEEKVGVHEVLAAGEAAWEGADGDAVAATEAFRSWWKKNLVGFDPGLREYNRIDERGRVFRRGDMGVNEARPNRSRHVLHHPVTGEALPTPKNGWDCSTETLLRRLEAGDIFFGVEPGAIPAAKRYLADLDSQVPKPTFEAKRSDSSKHLESVLGENRFPNPKDYRVLMRWFRMVTPNDGVILDFFGGSGSTMEAVIRLNAEDGGTRQCLLVTNNEVGDKRAAELKKEGHLPGDQTWEKWGVTEYATRPRITTILTGERVDGSTYSEGLPGRVAFFDLAHLDPRRVRGRQEFDAISPMLWMMAGAHGDIIHSDAESDGFAVTGGYGVLFDVAYRREFAEQVERAEPAMRFIVTDSDTEFAEAASLLPGGFSPENTMRLYTEYLSNFQTSNRAR